MRIVVLGCGFHGRGVAYEIAAAPGVETVVAADLNPARASRAASKTRGEAAAADLFDPDALDALLAGADLVFNAVGPYHRTARPVVEAAIRNRVPYCDMADDHEAAELLLLDPDWDARARAAGIGVVTGCGIAPGITGMLAKLGCERMARPRRVAARFSWNYSIAYPAAIHHFLRINSGLAPQFVGGALVRPGPFAEPETVRFLAPVGERRVYCTGINDPVSVPRSIPGLEEVTAKGCFHQEEANEFLEAMVRWGWTSYEPVPALGTSPFEALIAYLNSAQGRGRFDIAQEPVPMAIRVEVEGEDNGAPARLVFEGQDETRRGTTAPSAIVALMLARGELGFTGVRAPEGCVPTAGFFRALAAVPDVKLFEIDAKGEARPLAV
ncbi:MAG: hypothetical protein HOH66_13050 [Rhodospirillaceae bacterium]|nr:hypothetical protein [Rhodospirillaceae bacterium]